MAPDDLPSSTPNSDVAGGERRLLHAICDWMVSNLDTNQRGYWFALMPERPPTSGFQTPFFARLWEEVEDLFNHWPAVPRGFFFRLLAGDLDGECRETRLMLRLTSEILSYERPPEFLERVYKESVGKALVREDEVADNVAEIIRRLDAG